MNRGRKDGGLTQQEIANRLGMSRESVNRIEQRALEKLRRSLEDSKCRAIDTFPKKAG